MELVIIGLITIGVLTFGRRVTRPIAEMIEGCL